MKPLILSFDCVDYDPIDLWVPENCYDVDFWMNFTIGYDQGGGDNFLLHVVSPINLQGPESDKYAIVLTEYSWNLVLERVNNILEKCHGNNWSEISEKLSNHMYWEFENYKP